MEMNMKLGARIQGLRRARGMTQEALANAVGVSAGAVSKWETEASCPDIALLCPLARALHTNVDTLLSFEQALTPEQIGEIVAQIIETARTGDEAAAKAQMDRALHTYPSSCALKLNLAAAYAVLEMNGASEAVLAQKRMLYEAVHLEGDAAERQAAASALAVLALQEGRLDEAERLLSEIPEHTEDTIIQRVRIHEQRGERDKALAAVQKRLYVLAGKMHTCFILLGDLQADTEGALRVAQIAERVEAILGVGGDYSAGLLMMRHMQADNREAALECLGRYVDALTSPVPEPNPALFAPTIVMQEKRAAPQEMLHMALKGLTEEECLAPLRGEAAYAAAMEKLQRCIENEN